MSRLTPGPFTCSPSANVQTCKHTRRSFQLSNGTTFATTCADTETLSKTLHSTLLSCYPDMAENVAPAASADSTRGIPYYEKLKRDLRETLKKKVVLDKSLVRMADLLSSGPNTR